MKPLPLAALALVAAPHFALADAYITPSLTLARTAHFFGGYNHEGNFSNKDTTYGAVTGLTVAVGWRDARTHAGRAVTPELDLSWSRTDTASDSAPGLSYTSTIKTLRLGATFWPPLAQNGGWRTEAGIGAGMLYRDTATTDAAVSGEGSDLVPFGKVGLRCLRELKQGTLSVAVNYVLSGRTSIDLHPITGGNAGNFTYSSAGLEVEIGYQIPF